MSRGYASGVCDEVTCESGVSVHEPYDPPGSSGFVCFRPNSDVTRFQ